MKSTLHIINRLVDLAVLLSINLDKKEEEDLFNKRTIKYSPERNAQINQY